MGSEYVNFVLVSCSRSELDRGLFNLNKLVRNINDNEYLNSTVYPQSKLFYDRLGIEGIVFENDGFILQDLASNYLFILESRGASVVGLFEDSFFENWAVCYSSDTGDDVLYVESSEGLMDGYRTEEYDCDNYKTFKAKYKEVIETYIS